MTRTHKMEAAGDVETGVRALLVIVCTCGAGDETTVLHARCSGPPTIDTTWCHAHRCDLHSTERLLIGNEMVKTAPRWNPRPPRIDLGELVGCNGCRPSYHRVLVCREELIAKRIAAHKNLGERA